MPEVETWFHDFDGQPHGEWYCTDDEPDGEFDLVDPGRAGADLLRERIDGVTGD